METNKLLTLEEIENLEKSAHARALVGNVWFEALLATARAYHELAKESIEDEKRYVETLWQDKPHLSTLKVIVEAMKGMLNQYHFANSNIECGDLATFTESLEKHLE